MLASNHLIGFGAAPSSTTYATTTSLSLTTDVGSFGGYTFVDIISAANRSISSGTLMRLTFTGPASGTHNINNVYVGFQAGAGDVYDFDGGQVAVTVAGSASFTLTSGGTAVSDDISFADNNTKNLLIAFNFGATATVRYVAAAGGNAGYYKAAVSEASTTDRTGYTSYGQVLTVSKIEVA